MHSIYKWLVGAQISLLDKRKQTYLYHYRCIASLAKLSFQVCFFNFTSEIMLTKKQAFHGEICPKNLVNGIQPNDISDSGKSKELI